MRGDLAQALREGPGSSAGKKRHETSSYVLKNQGFQLRRPQLFEIIENRGQSLLSDRAESSIRYQGLELKL